MTVSGPLNPGAGMPIIPGCGSDAGVHGLTSPDGLRPKGPLRRT